MEDKTVYWEISMKTTDVLVIKFITFPDIHWTAYSAEIHPITNEEQWPKTNRTSGHFDGKVGVSNAAIGITDRIVPNMNDQNKTLVEFSAR